jgi:fructose-1,6-bisphosphatase II
MDELIDPRPTRNLALELVRVTEASVLSTGRFMGRGDKNAADKAAVEGLRLLLNTIQMDGVIVIGEGEKDEVPMLYNGERLGTGAPPEVDIAVDPIDGTRPLAQGLGNTICAVAMAPRGSMFNPGPFLYMDKIAVGPEARDVIDIHAPIADNLAKIARVKGEDIEDLTVVVLDRARHQELITAVRQAGARLRMIPDGDVAAALMTCMPETGIDVLMGIGGSPEGVIAACALRCMGGGMQCRLVARGDEEIRRGLDLGYEVNKVLTLQDLITSDDIFFSATGITTGDLLHGVDYYANGARTDSLVMRGLTGTVRRITANHRLDKLKRISSREY